jgi:sec-independent protein translocase protein TatC
MSFIEHLEELRRRLLWSLAAVAVCLIFTYNFSKQIFDFLMQPIIKSLPQGSTLIFIKPAEGFTTYLKVAFFAAIVLALPFMLYQLRRFVTPALYKREKQVAIPFILFGTVFFAVGAAFC